MPIQAPQWTDYLNCPVCCREFGTAPRSPVSLSCGHTICKHCLAHLHRRQCPFDQAVIQVDSEELVVNTALLQLAGYPPPAQPPHPPSIQALPDNERHAYDIIVHCIEDLATYLKYSGNTSNTSTNGRLSRPMQRKLVTLVQCALTVADGRGRTARAARSLGERTVTELILQHQNPQQLSANLWAAVRARGCQFLGPAMQEEVLKLVLLALEDGSALSRKVLVLFIVQRLEPHFPQASKTSIGHVVQLLYRASCFKVSKRESDSSLMQLKEEFRTYESLRREHDAQIVQIATEAGLRIAPDQWSALLYGDAVHKSQMQSIIDKLQTPQSFAQSIQELFIALQRTGDPVHLANMNMHLDTLASIDSSPDSKSPTWMQLAEILTSLKEVVSGLIHYLQQGAKDSNHNQKQLLVDSSLVAGNIQAQRQYMAQLCLDPSCPQNDREVMQARDLQSQETLFAVSAMRRDIVNGNAQYNAVAMARVVPGFVHPQFQGSPPMLGYMPQIPYNIPRPPYAQMYPSLPPPPPTSPLGFEYSPPRVENFNRQQPARSPQAFPRNGYGANEPPANNGVMMQPPPQARPPGLYSQENYYAPMNQGYLAQGEAASTSNHQYYQSTPEVLPEPNIALPPPNNPWSPQDNVFGLDNHVNHPLDLSLPANPNARNGEQRAADQDEAALEEEYRNLQRRLEKDLDK